VDLGLTTFATLSTGEQIISPKPLKNAMRKLRRLGRWHSRKQPHSRNRAKAQMKLAREHRRVKNIRQDFLHKLSTRLAKNHSEICVEDLNVSGLTSSPRLKPGDSKDHAKRIQHRL
jgi:putative transposase